MMISLAMYGPHFQLTAFRPRLLTRASLAHLHGLQVLQSSNSLLQMLAITIVAAEPSRVAAATSLPFEQFIHKRTIRPCISGASRCLLPWRKRRHRAGLTP